MQGSCPAGLLAQNVGAQLIGASQLHRPSPFHGGTIMSDSRYDIGMQVRKEVLGSEHVERAQAGTTEFDADFQRFLTETAWGFLWARPDLDRRTRSLVTIAILAALGREELAMHLHASRNTGVDPHEIAEVLLHV